MTAQQVPGELVERLVSARHVMVLTGAGVSAESGVPTFRDAQTGLWTRFRPEELATVQAFEDISAAAVTGAHTAGVRKFLTICSHSGDAVQTALNAKAGLGAGKVIKGSKGAARVVEWPDGTLLAVPETHLSMDAY